MKIHWNEDLLPAFFLPQGKWRTLLTVKEKTELLIEGNVNFEIVEYTSEKQKKYMG